MTEYETIYIAHPDLDETHAKNLTEKMSGICSGNGAHLLAFRDWGVRKLAYEIDKNRRGRYFYINYLSGQQRTVPEVERNLRFDEKILRYMTVQVGKVEDIPARLEAAKTQTLGSAPSEQTPYGEERGASRHSSSRSHSDQEEMLSSENDSMSDDNR